MISKLPLSAVNAIASMKHQVSVLSEPWKEKREAVHPLTMQRIEQEVTIVPRINLLIEMPAPRTLHVYAHRVKPMAERVLLREFKDADFDALRQQVENADGEGKGVSWEEYFVRVVNG